jgi:hypothetical protein
MLTHRARQTHRLRFHTGLTCDLCVRPLAKSVGCQPLTVDETTRVASNSEVKNADTAPPGVPRRSALAVSGRVSRSMSSRLGTWTTSWRKGSSKCSV